MQVAEHMFIWAWAANTLVDSTGKYHQQRDNMSEVKVNKISPRSGTGVQLGDSGDTINSYRCYVNTTANTSVANAALQGSGQITINGQAVALGGSINN